MATTLGDRLVRDFEAAKAASAGSALPPADRTRAILRRLLVDACAAPGADGTDGEAVFAMTLWLAYLQQQVLPTGQALRHAAGVAVKQADDIRAARRRRPGGGGDDMQTLHSIVKAPFGRFNYAMSGSADLLQLFEGSRVSVDLNCADFVLYAYCIYRLAGVPVVACLEHGLASRTGHIWLQTVDGSGDAYPALLTAQFLDVARPDAWLPYAEWRRVLDPRAWAGMCEVALTPRGVCLYFCNISVAGQWVENVATLADRRLTSLQAARFLVSLVHALRARILGVPPAEAAAASAAVPADSALGRDLSHLLSFCALSVRTLLGEVMRDHGQSVPGNRCSAWVMTRTVLDACRVDAEERATLRKLADASDAFMTEAARLAPCNRAASHDTLIGQWATPWTAWVFSFCDESYRAVVQVALHQAVEAMVAWHATYRGTDGYMLLIQETALAAGMLHADTTLLPLWTAWLLSVSDDLGVHAGVLLHIRAALTACAAREGDDSMAALLLTACDALEARVKRADLYEPPAASEVVSFLDPRVAADDRYADAFYHRLSTNLLPGRLRDHVALGGSDNRPPAKQARHDALFAGQWHPDFDALYYC